MHKRYDTVFSLLFLGVFSYFIKFFFNAFTAQFLTPDLYGDFAIAIQSVLIISLLLLLGTNLSSVKYISSFFNNNDSDSASEFIRWNLKLIAITFLLCFAVFFIVYLLFIFLHIITYKNFDEHHYFIYSLWLAPFSAFYLLLASFILSYKHNNLALFFNKIAMYIFLIIFLFITVFFLELSIKFYHIILFLFFAYSIIISIELFLVRRILVKHNVHIRKKITEIKPERKKKWLADSVRLTSIQLVFNLVCFFDLLVIEWIHPDEYSTGYYAAMLVIVNVLWVVPSSITLYFVPLITPLLEKKNYGKLQSLIDLTNYINIPISVVMLLIIILFSNFFLSLFDPMYTVVQIPLIVLSIGYFLGAAAFSNARILIFLDSKKALYINITELTILVITSFTFTYFFGVLGMTFAVLISISTKTSLMYLCVKKRIPIKPFSII